MMKLYDFDYDEWLQDVPNWVQEAPDWVQQRLANNAYIASDESGYLEKVNNNYYRVHAMGHVYGCVPEMDWLR